MPRKHYIRIRKLAENLLADIKEALFRLLHIQRFYIGIFPAKLPCPVVVEDGRQLFYVADKNQPLSTAHSDKTKHYTRLRTLVHNNVIVLLVRTYSRVPVKFFYRMNCACEKRNSFRKIIFHII